MADDWRREAEARIARHRISTCSLVVTHAGRPVAGRRLRLRLAQPEFLFGTCIAGDPASADEDQQRYFHEAAARFTALTCENAMKWYATEPKAGDLRFAEADALLAWGESRGLPMRGHCLLWSKEKFAQEWVRGLDPATLRVAVTSQVERSAARWRGRLACWDAFNELLDGRYYQERLGEGIAAEVFRQAAACDPAAPLFVNEYGVLDGGEKQRRYLDLIAALRAAGAPVGGIGLQEHACERFAGDRDAAAADEGRPERQGRGPLIPDEVWRRLDDYAATGLPLHVTEVSCRTDDEERRAQALEMFLVTAYAHPAVRAFTMWGFWAGRHWLGRSAALLDERWRETPAGAAWRDLVCRRWRSDVMLTTGADGRCDLTGHRGRYVIEADGVPVASLRLSADRSQAAVTLA